MREFQRLHGLDRPLPAQYAAFVGGIVVGDFGRSLRFEQPILPIILERLPATLELAGASLASDRRRGFLDLVLVTPLSGRDIVDGTLLEATYRVANGVLLAMDVEVVGKAE